jgi:phosphinothricin acetyltransferase
MPTMRVRPFDPGDAAAVAAIYNQAIEDRTATFETQPRSAASIAEQFGARALTHPALVVERDGVVVAAAWAAEYRPRPAYAGVAEVSIYVAREARGKGAGRMALAGLIEAAEAKGFWKLVSRIFPENLASRRLCAGLGFREVGIYRRHARLEGEWRDCIIVERLLAEAQRD